jgi:hypothetical protein
VVASGYARRQVPHPLDWKPLSDARIVTTAGPLVVSLAVTLSDIPPNPDSRAQ